jgi:hypothetical protein
MTAMRRSEMSVRKGLVIIIKSISTSSQFGTECHIAILRRRRRDREKEMGRELRFNSLSAHVSASSCASAVNPTSSTNFLSYNFHSGSLLFRADLFSANLFEVSGVEGARQQVFNL